MKYTIEMDPVLTREMLQALEDQWDELDGNEGLYFAILKALRYGETDNDKAAQWISGMVDYKRSLLNNVPILPAS